MNDETRPLTLTTESMLYRKGRIIFLEKYGNGVYVYDVERAVTELLCRIKEEEFQKRLSIDMVIAATKLYIIPFAASNIYIIDLEMKSYQNIAIPQPRIYVSNYVNRAKFGKGFLYQDNLYLVGISYPAILKYNLQTAEIKYIDNWVNKVMEMSNIRNQSAFTRKCCVHEGKLYIPLIGCNYFMVLDLETEQYKFYQVGSTDSGYSVAYVTDETLWLLPYGNGDLVIWNISTHEWREIKEYFRNDNAYMNRFTDMIRYGNYIYIIPNDYKCVLRIHIESQKVECIVKKNNSLFMAGIIGNDRLYLVSSANEDIYIIHNNDDIEVRRIFVPVSQIDYYKRQNSELYRVIYCGTGEKKEWFEETYRGALKDFMEYIEGLFENYEDTL